MFRFRLMFVLLSLAFSFSLAGCGQVSQGQSNTMVNNIIHKDGMVIQLRISENPVIARKKTDLTVRLSSGTASSQLQVQKVWIQESMSDMSMPKSITPMRSSQSATYTGQSIFPMGGPWVLEVYVKLPNKTVNVAFPVHVQE